MSQTGKIVIHSLEDLIDVFPSLTEKQIILLFRKCVYELKRTDRLLGLCRNDLVRDALLERVSACTFISDFLSGYIVRCFFKMSVVDFIKKG